MQNQPLKNNLRVIQIIHMAMMMMPIVFAVVIYFIMTEGNPEINEGLEFFSYLPPAFLVVGFLVGSFLFKTNIKKLLANGPNLKEKVSGFMGAHIIRIAMLEFAGIFSGVVVLLNGNLNNLVVVVLASVVLMTKIPSVRLLDQEIGLTQEEQEALR